MDIYLIGHDYRYAVEQMLLTLYPEERPVYPETPPAGDSLTIALRRGTKFAVAVCRFKIDGAAVSAQARCLLLPGTPELDTVRLEQRIVKLAFYRAALAAGHSRPIWGCLTGVRPAKFLTGLMRRDGLSVQQAERKLTKEFDVSPDRAALAAAAAREALEVQKSLSPEDVCLYIGIPFCPTRCAYCSFVSVDAPRMLRQIPEYLSALEKEMEATAEAIRSAGKRVISVYIGGGTPTTLSALELGRLLTAVKQFFDLSACREFTVEAGRPDTVTEEKLRALRAHGVDRVSVNPQTMSDEVLAAIGRHHTVQEVCDAVKLVKKVGGLAFNMDLIAGLPGDTPASFARTIDAVIALHPENITVHTLALKKGSRFLMEGTALPGGEDVGRMLSDAREKLTRTGYAPYYLYRQKFMSGSFENVGWTRPGYSNLYNICIMEELCPILAAGAGGSTKLTAPGGIVKRLMPPKYPKEYMERIDETCAAKAEIVRFYSESRKGEIENGQ